MQKLFDDKKINIFSAGKLVFQNGFVIGLLAVRELKIKFSNFKWLIAGDGPKAEELLTHIQLMNLAGNVELTGKKNVNEIYKLYEDADIFFSPQVSEGIANVVLVAMSMQLPVVCSSAGRMNEIIANGISGLVCKNFDYRAMAEQLLELCTNEKKRNLFGVEGRKKVNEFDLKKDIDVFEDEYYKVFS